MIDIEQYNRALDNIEVGKLYDGFASIVKIYKDADEAERTNIFTMLLDVFYSPNIDYLRENYEKNRISLQDYPYWFAPKAPDFDDLSILLFPVTEEIGFLFDKAGNDFTEIELGSQRETKYFFKDLSKPLFVENETNEFNLRFLVDNVRASEDVAMDNHIYLYYEQPKYIHAIMQYYSFAYFLQEKKPVFLIGTDNKKLYPIDFKKAYGINYRDMPKRPLGINEMNRLCFWFKHPYAGTSFAFNVLASNSKIASYSGYTFHADARINEMPFQAPWIKTLGGDNSITMESLNEFFEDPKNVIKPDSLRKDFEKLKVRFADVESFTVNELFRAFFIVHSEEAFSNSRIVPIILYDPHIWDIRIYDDIISSFRYTTILTSFREPTMVFARSYEYGLIWNEFQTKYIFGSEYTHAQLLNPEFRKDYYGFTFENLKLKPREMLLAICKLLNTPYEKNMLLTKAPMTSKTGETVQGFEATPLKRNISHVFSDFDRMRLNIFYAPIHKYYGYDYFDNDEYELRDLDVEMLFSYPFRFERSYRDIYKGVDISPSTMRQWLYDSLISGYKSSKSGDIVFPQLIKPEE